MISFFQGKSNVSEVLPTGQLSNIPWRRQGVKYTNNEAYFDVIEVRKDMELLSIVCIHVDSYR